MITLELNKDVKRRDEIIGNKGMRGKKSNGEYDTYHFSGMTLKTLETLVDENFISLNEAQNSAPTVGEILKFMRGNPRFTCHGYAVTLNRSDYRVSLEGVELIGKTTNNERQEFTSLFRHADDFTCDKNGCFCWFD